MEAAGEALRPNPACALSPQVAWTFKLPPATPLLSLLTNLDFNTTQPVLVYWFHSQLVVTTALILTFSPRRRDSDCMRLFTWLCIVRIQSRVPGGSGVQGASLLGEMVSAFLNIYRAWFTRLIRTQYLFKRSPKYNIIRT